jgi:hypothetical protein
MVRYIKLPENSIVLMKYNSERESYLPVVDRVLRNTEKATGIDFIGNMNDLVEKNTDIYPNLKKLDIVTIDDPSKNTPRIHKSIEEGSKKGILVSCDYAPDLFDTSKNCMKFFKNLTNNFRKYDIGLLMFLDEEHGNPLLRKLYHMVDYIIAYPEKDWKARIIKKP